LSRIYTGDVRAWSTPHDYVSSPSFTYFVSLFLQVQVPYSIKWQCHLVPYSEQISTTLQNTKTVMGIIKREDDFPLGSEQPGDTGFDTAPGVGSGTEGGAAGHSSDSVLSTGGLVAIIVVVVLVTIIGGLFHSCHLVRLLASLLTPSQSLLLHCSSSPRSANGP
jgi:hypothetical protein